MKRVPILMLLLVAFVSFATVNGFADNSPPGIEVGISYEMPEGAEINVEIQVAQVWQSIQLNNIEDRIAVYDCDLKCWPGIENVIYAINNIARMNSTCDDALFWPIESLKALNKDKSNSIKINASNQYRLSGNENEVLSIYGK